jgi:hypothetical protein
MELYFGGLMLIFRFSGHYGYVLDACGECEHQLQLTGFLLILLPSLRVGEELLEKGLCLNN